MAKKSYTREFKLHASRMVLEQGYTHTEAAKKLGTSPRSIRDWIEKFRGAGELGPLSSEAEEIKRLRKENADLRQDNEILKKAAAYFAKESL